MSTFKYAFTVTLKPRLFSNSPTEQYDMTYTRLHSILNCLSIPESLTLVAELTKACNIHYHGMIIMHVHPKKSAKVRFHNAFRHERDYGFVNLTQIDDEPGWIAYISKNIKSTKDDIDRPPIICDEFKQILHPTIGYAQIFI